MIKKIIRKLFGRQEQGKKQMLECPKTGIKDVDPDKDTHCVGCALGILGTLRKA